MEAWLTNAAIACCLYAAWAMLSKSAETAGLTTNESQAVQLLPRILFTTYQIGFKGLRDCRWLDLPLTGTSYSLLSCLATILAGFYYSDALLDGSGAAVAAISGSYPAVAYVVGVFLGTENLETYKILGVVLAVASCLCFAQ